MVSGEVLGIRKLLLRWKSLEDGELRAIRRAMYVLINCLARPKTEENRRDNLDIKNALIIMQKILDANERWSEEQEYDTEKN